MAIKSKLHNHKLDLVINKFYFNNFIPLKNESGRNIKKEKKTG